VTVLVLFHFGYNLWLQCATMTKLFPSDPFLKGNYAPIRMECDLHDLVIEGEVPPEMCGTFYRNGPDPQYPPREDGYHWFMGDGMIHAFAVNEGRISYRNRWMRTRKWQLEHEARETLFGLFGNPMTSHPSVLGEPFNVANTSVLSHGGKIFALEEGNPPFEFDAHTLDSKGAYTFGGKLEGPMTAHPKVDPHTGECIFFGYMADGPGTHTVSYHTVNREGEITRAERFESRYCSMMHDFFVTQEHVVFPVFPVALDIERAMNGGPPLAWDPDLGAHLAVMRRDGSVKKIRWFQGNPSYVYHAFNAQTVHENGRTKILADVIRYPRAPFFPDLKGRVPRENPSALVRWTLDLDEANATWTEQPLSDLMGDFPRIDERLTGLSYRYGYMAVRAPGSKGEHLGSIARIDVTSGNTTVWNAGEHSFVGEPVFVPRSANSSESDGWLLALVYRADEHRSEFVILPADDLAHGPVARAHLPHRVPFGFHGAWVAR
jgi:carotenoid cleavage dioxygenase-like enzyme